MIELTTQCPQCQSTFDVTLAQLQQRKGLWRCVQCAHIFDAYECAVDGPVPTTPAAQPTPSVPPIVRPRTRSEGTINSTQPIQRTGSDSVEKDIRVYLDKSDYPAVTEVKLPSTDVDTAICFVPEPRQDYSTPASGSSSSSGVGLLWWGLFWVLLVIALAQLTYIYRVQIANTVSFTRPVLQLMCDITGCDIPYMREAKAIDIVHSSLMRQQLEGSNDRYAYILQLQLKNNLAWAQEWPTLVVTLNDAAAAGMATVAIAPDQYLAPSQRQRPFASGEQYNVRIPISLKNKKINGFTVEKYYP